MKMMFGFDFPGFASAAMAVEAQSKTRNIWIEQSALKQLALVPDPELNVRRSIESTKRFNSLPRLGWRPYGLHRARLASCPRGCGNYARDAAAGSLYQ